jgi:hypothetical protein
MNDTRKPAARARLGGAQKSPLLAAFLDDIRAFCGARRGRAAALALELKVAPSQLSAWLGGRFEPGGEVVLQMQGWLARERAAEALAAGARVAAAPARLRAAMRGVSE